MSARLSAPSPLCCYSKRPRWKDAFPRVHLGKPHGVIFIAHMSNLLWRESKFSSRWGYSFVGEHIPTSHRLWVPSSCNHTRAHTCIHIHNLRTGIVDVVQSYFLS